MLTGKNLPFCKFLLANNCFPVDTIPWREYSPGGPILQLFITILNITILLLFSKRRQTCYNADRWARNKIMNVSVRIVST